MPILTKICPICGSTFTCWQRPKREVKTCNVKCGAQLRRRAQPPQPKLARYRTLTCTRCGREYTRLAHRRATTCCGYVCSAKARWEDPSFREKPRATRRTTEEERARMSAWMTRLNSDPMVREKASRAKRGKTFAGVRGGNGQ